MKWEPNISFLPQFITSSHSPTVTDVCPLQEERGGENTTIIFYNGLKAFTATPRGTFSIPLLFCGTSAGTLAFVLNASLLAPQMS